MKLLKTLAVALAVAAAGSTFAQTRDVTITRETPNGTIVKHVERYGDYHRHHVRYDHREYRRVRVVKRVVWTDHHGRRHIRRIVTWRTVPMHSRYVINRHVEVRHYG